MSRMGPVIRREFTEAVQSKAFLIGTVLGPLLLLALFGLQFLVLAKGGGGEHRILVLDATAEGLGARVVETISAREAGPSFISRATFDLALEHSPAGDRAALTGAASRRVVEKEIDGYLWIPADVLTGAPVEYEGSNATNSQVTDELQGAVQAVVQSERLRSAGIDEARLGGALQPVPMRIARTGEKGDLGNPAAAVVLSFMIAFAIYFVVMMYGQSILSSVQEEKRDRIVELIVSSVRSRDLLVGKVLGIGSAGVLQMVVWATTAAVLLTYGATIAMVFGADQETVQTAAREIGMPHVPLSVGVAFVLYFAGGFLLFATLFAVVGSIVTNAQEAQQFVFPIFLPFMLGLFIAMTAAENPNGAIAVAGSFVPFTSAIVMPVRVTVAAPPWWEVGASVVLLYATALGTIILAGKIYRVAIFATGQKPRAREILRWLRAA